VDAATAAAAAATSAAAAAGAEQPCTVKLRVWAHDASDPLRPLRDARLQIPHAVLCSEMGAHFSPRGRKLAVCAACVPKGAPNPMPGAPIPDLVYELRVYSLEPGRSFGEVLSARAIRAAHCLTSVQFSPDGEHVLVAYGRRHASLLLLVADGGRCVAVHTVLETYRARDMALVRSLASAEDEVNVACFHPEPGGGVAYGTKEGKLRVLRHDKPPVLEPDEGGAPAGAEPETRPTAVGRCLQDELRETLEWSEDEGSGHDDGSEDGSGDGEESGEETDNRLSRE
jgi:activator-of-BECN1-regulated-autophagy protein 1